MSKVIFRPVQKKDLDEVYLLLQQMTKIDYSKRDKNKNWKLIELGSSESIVGIIDNKVIAYGSLVLEYKIRGSISGHIEDIVVSHKVRHQNILSLSISSNFFKWFLIHAIFYVGKEFLKYM